MGDTKEVKRAITIAALGCRACSAASTATTWGQTKGELRRDCWSQDRLRRLSTPPIRKPNTSPSAFEIELWLDLEMIPGLANCLGTNSNVRGLWWTFNSFWSADLDSERRLWTSWIHSQGAGNETRAAHRIPIRFESNVMRPAEQLRQCQS